MSAIVNPTWKKRMYETLDNNHHVDETISANKASQWLIEQLTNRDRPFVVHNLGAGVKRITTNTTTCPCCKKPL